MTVKERLDKFDSDFAKLKNNRANVPLEILQTQYAKSYTALVDDIIDFAGWFTAEYIKSLSDCWPISDRDTAGNEWLQKKQAAILQRERHPGGLYDQQVAALVDRLDLDRFYDLVWRLYNRLETEAFDPYWQRHCRWVGQPGNRWVYNDIIKKFWYPPGKSENWPDGVWMDNEYHAYGTNYPPHMKADRSD